MLTDTSRYHPLHPALMDPVLRIDGRRSTIDRRLTQALDEMPGSTALQLSQRLHVGRTTATRGLARLEAAGQVRRVRGGHRDDGPRQPDTWTWLPPAAPKRVAHGALAALCLDWLNANPGPRTITQISSGLGRSKGAIGNTLTRLATTGQVRPLKGRPLRYQAVTHPPERE